MRVRIVLLLAVAGCLAGQPFRESLNRGVQAFKNGQYAAAVDAFLTAVNLEPANETARLYLGTAYMQQYIPGAESPENQAFARNAETAFQSVLGLNSANAVALASLASLNLNMKKFEDARGWYQRLLAVDQGNAEAWYSLGFLAWARWYPAYQEARRGLGMKQEDPGPLPDAPVRAALRAQWMPALDEGISSLARALAVNPEYADAMAYMNLLIRERADLRDTQEEYTSDVAEADRWVQKALEVRKRQSQRREAAPPPPPPPPPPAGNGGASDAPRRIRGSFDLEGPRMISKPAAVYPPEAQQARITGTVKLAVTIGANGRVKSIQVVSGHPFLIKAAVDAVKQYVYVPVRRNGEPIEVLHEEDVYFTLPYQNGGSPPRA